MSDGIVAVPTRDDAAALVHGPKLLDDGNDSAHGHVNAYAVSFPTNVRTPEVWHPIREAIEKEWRDDADFRGNYELWRDTCAAESASGRQGFPGLLTRFHARFLDREAKKRTEAELKALPAPAYDDATKSYRATLFDIYHRFTAGILTRGTFLNAMAAEARKAGALHGDEGNLLHRSREYFASLNGGLESRCGTSVLGQEIAKAMAKGSKSAVGAAVPV